MSIHHRVWLSLGSNLGNRIQNIEKAISKLSQMKNTHLIQISSFYETAPIQCEGNDFINVALELKSQLALDPFFDQMMNIESELGRTRAFPNAPRIIDIDMLYYEALLVKSEKIMIPHPRIQERAFVLIPLKELNCPYLDPQKLVRIENQTIKKLPHLFNHNFPH